MTPEDKRLIVNNLSLAISYLRNQDRDVCNKVEEVLDTLKTNWNRDDYYYMEMIKSINNS